MHHLPTNSQHTRASTRHLIHVSRVPFRAVLQFPFNHFLQWMHSKVAKRATGGNVFATHKPFPPLWACGMALPCTRLELSGRIGEEEKKYQHEISR